MINAPVQWDASLETGDEVIDGQHQALFGMILELDGRMSREEYGPGVLEAVHGMKAYAAAHFKLEEELMAKAGWPHLVAHMGMHAQFMQRTAFFGHDLLSESEWTALDVLRYLLAWLRSHIEVHDRRFFEWSRGR